MCHLNDRQVQLAKVLLQTQSFTTITTCADILSMSYKTIANDLQVLDSYFATFGIVMEKKPRVGIRLHISEDMHQQVSEALEGFSVREDKTTVEERRKQILLTFLWHPQDTFSIQQFSDQYYVSTSSIAHDIDVLAKQLEPYHCSFSKSKKGTRLTGKEIDIRKVLLSYMEIFLYETSGYERYQQLDAAFYQIHKQDVPTIQDMMDFLEQEMESIEAISKKIINEPYYTNAFLYIVLVILRIKLGFTMHEKEELPYPDDEIDEQDFLFTKNLSMELAKKYDISIHMVEAINIHRHLISGGLSKKEIAIVEKNTKENNLNSLTLAYTRYLIEHMSALFGIDFTNQVYLHSNLRFHIKPMLNRLRYDVRIHNMMLEEMKKRYPMDFYITYISCMLTSKRYELEMPSPEEVCYIMVYFQTAKERHLHQIKALLVSQNSVGSTHLLKTRIENTFHDFEVLDILNPGKLQQVDMDHIDLILSTGGISMNLPYVTISPFLDDVDITNIKHYLRTLKKQEQTQGDPLTIQVVEGEVDIHHPYAIHFDLDEHREVYIYQAEHNQVIQEERKHTMRYALTYQTLPSLYWLLYHVCNESYPL